MGRETQKEILEQGLEGVCASQGMQEGRVTQKEVRHPRPQMLQKGYLLFG